MEKLVNFLKTDKGKLVGIAAGIVLLLLVIWAATPNSINLIINSGQDCAIGFKSAKKTTKRKPQKAKKKK
ncbi:MAG: hypothetical protein IK093_15035 [Ruminiclostridium sp.]|nr:hypothetical protein [Ruminiclostridium sp.]